ncbi:MAG: hypothetical protein ABJA67_14695 [Chthonomonadales bacterium]
MLRKKVHPLLVVAAFSLSISAEAYAFVRMTDIVKRPAGIMGPQMMNQYIKDHQGQWYSQVANMKRFKEWKKTNHASNSNNQHEKAS